MFYYNPLTPDSNKSKTDEFSNNKHSKVLLNSFPMNDHTLGFCPQNQKLENCVSSKVNSGSQRVNKQHHSKVLLNSFPMNGHTLGFCS